MHVELSDLLTCPRCGPSYGLILLPTEVRDRRVESGVLGCANCRERYPVEGGDPDLRTGTVAGEVGAIVASAGASAAASMAPGAGPAQGAVPAPDRDEAVRLAALLDLSDGGGTVLVAGRSAVHASLLAELVPDVGVLVVRGDVEGGGQSGVAGDPEAGASGPGGGSATRLRVDASLPIRGSALRGVALTGGWSALIEEGARLLRPAGRLVLDPAPSDAGARLAASGLAILLNETGVVVAGRGR